MFIIPRTLLFSRYLTSSVPFRKSNKRFYKHYAEGRVSLNMNEVLLQHEEGDDHFEVSLRYVNADLNFDRQFRFNRNVDEPISKFIRRMDANISAQMQKKLKKKMKKSTLESPVTDTVQLNDKAIKFLKNDSVLDDDTTCRTILEDPSDIKLIIFDTQYTVKRNVPCVKKIQLSSSILVGFPTYPTKFECVHMDKENSTIKWYKQSHKDWVHVGDGYLYTPSISDIGCRLRVTCIPRKGTQVGPMVQIESQNEVKPGPGFCPFETRHAFTSNKLSGKSFRVASYNILADVYSQTDLSRDVLYPYCPQYALSMDYRKLLILKELMGYNADIICLQEVDDSVYTNDLVPTLHTLNYDSIYNLKNDLREGIAIFYNRERFDQLSCCYSVVGQNTDFVDFNPVWSQIQNENVKETFKNRSTIIQAIALKSKENSEILIVGNTHLYFKPEAGYVRLLQAYYGLMYLRRCAAEMKEKNPECNVSILYCGDFNSCPENGVYQLMSQQYIPEDYADWKSSPDEYVENVSLEHDCNLSSACGTPEYTNYTGTFSGCLDYIFYEKDHLEVEQVIPMPSTEELSLCIGLPSVVFPSDHICICADLKWSK